MILKKEFERPLVSCAIGIITIISALPFMGTYLFGWDAAQFALGIHEFDIAKSQPHSPGYPILIFLARLLYFFIGDANLSLIGVMLAFSAAASIALYLFIQDITADRNLAILGTLFFVFNPIFWFHREIALSYSADALAGTLVPLFACRIIFKHDTRCIYYLAVSMAFLGGVRSFLIPFFSLLFLYSLYHVRKEGAGPGTSFFARFDYRTIISACVLLPVLTLLWFVPLAYLSGGLDRYLAISRGYFLVMAKERSWVMGAPWKVNYQQIRHVLAAFFAGITGILIPLAVLVFISIKHRIMRKNTEPGNMKIQAGSFTLFILCWIIPSLAMYMLIHFGNGGYLLTIIPAFHIFATFGMGHMVKHVAGRIVIPVLLLLQCALFMFVPSIYILPMANPGKLEESGTVIKTMYKIDPWLLLFNADAIRKFDGHFNDLVSDIDACMKMSGGTVKMMIVVPASDTMTGWRSYFRQVQYYYHSRTVEHIDANANKTIEITNDRVPIIFVPDTIRVSDLPRNGIVTKRKTLYCCQMGDGDKINLLGNNLIWKK